MGVWLANFAVLIIASFVLTLMMEFIAGNKQFTLHLGNIFFVTLLGSILAIWFSWKSTGILLSLYAIFIIGVGSYERMKHRGHPFDKR